MPGRGARRTVSLLLAGVFLLSLGGEAYGWHDCPHHHPRSRDAETSAEAHGIETSISGAGTAPLRPAGGPCTCVGSCHATAASPAPPRGPGAPIGTGNVCRVALLPESRSLRPRLSPYLLPYPTGPPSA